MSFQQNQITWATTTTGSDSNNYNRHRNLFRLVFSEQRSHEEEEKEEEKNELPTRSSVRLQQLIVPRNNNKINVIYTIIRVVIAIANKS